LLINAPFSVFAELSIYTVGFTVSQAGNLRADQITFINNIIDYLSTNGVIDKSMLFETPFTFAHQDGLLGVFDDADAGKVIQLIDSVNDNALVYASA